MERQETKVASRVATWALGLVAAAFPTGSAAASTTAEAANKFRVGALAEAGAGLEALTAPQGPLVVAAAEVDKSKPGAGKGAGAGHEGAAHPANMKVVADAEKILRELQKKGYPAEDVARAVLALDRVWEATRGADAPVGLFGQTKEHLKIARVTQEEHHPLNSGLRIDSGIRNGIGVIATLIAKQFGGEPLDEKQFQYVEPHRPIFGPTLAARYGVRYVPMAGVVMDATNRNAATKGTSNQMALSEQPVQTLLALCGSGLTPFVSARMMDRAFFRPTAGQDGLSIGDREGWQNLLLVCGPKLPEIMKKVDELARKRDLKGLDAVAKQVAGLVAAFEKKFDKKELDGPTATEPVMLRPNDWQYFKIAIEPKSGDKDKNSGLKVVIWNVYQYGRLNAFLERVLAGSTAAPELQRAFPEGDYPNLSSWLQVKAICGDELSGAWAELVGNIIGKPGKLELGADFIGMLDVGLTQESPTQFLAGRVGSQSRDAYLASLDSQATGGSDQDVAERKTNILLRLERKGEDETDEAFMKRLLVISGEIAERENEKQRNHLRTQAAAITVELLSGKKSPK